MTKKSETGEFGESLACEFLMKGGYKIIDRNFRKPWGEIDIVAEDPDKTLVFVEVKTMYGRNNNDDHNYDWDVLKPEDQMSAAKYRKVARTASLYASEHPEHINESKGWRIDLIAVVLEQNKTPDTRHYKNISI